MVYANQMSTLLAPPCPKIQRTVTLDADLVETFAGDENDKLSSKINAILREEHERQIRRESLAQLCQDIEDIWGSPDPEKVAEAMRILSS